MATYQPTGILLHLITGNKRMFYQENEELVAKICGDLDGSIFSRASLVIEGLDDVTAIPGHALIGITILTKPIPDSFYESERLSKTIVTQISEETFQFRRLTTLSQVEGERRPLLSELEFANGERLFLEFSEIAVNGMDERNVLNHLFTRPSLSCRRLEGGFSIWNMAHIVSWSYHPKVEVPPSAWQADSMANPSNGDAKIVNMVDSEEIPIPTSLRLSGREEEILSYATKGYKDAAIANKLGISQATVYTYWSRIRIKMGHYGRTELVARALQEENSIAMAHLRSDNEKLVAETIALSNSNNVIAWQRQFAPMQPESRRVS